MRPINQLSLFPSPHWRRSEQWIFKSRQQRRNNIGQYKHINAIEQDFLLTHRGRDGTRGTGTSGFYGTLSFPRNQLFAILASSHSVWYRAATFVGEELRRAVEGLQQKVLLQSFRVHRSHLTHLNATNMSNSPTRVRRIVATLCALFIVVVAKSIS